MSVESGVQNSISVIPGAISNPNNQAVSSNNLGSLSSQVYECAFQPPGQFLDEKLWNQEGAGLGDLESQSQEVQSQMPNVQNHLVYTLQPSPSHTIRILGENGFQDHNSEPIQELLKNSATVQLSQQRSDSTSKGAGRLSHQSVQGLDSTKSISVDSGILANNPNINLGNGTKRKVTQSWGIDYLIGFPKPIPDNTPRPSICQRLNTWIFSSGCLSRFYNKYFAKHCPDNSCCSSFTCCTKTEHTEADDRAKSCFARCCSSQCCSSQRSSFTCCTKTEHTEADDRAKSCFARCCSSQCRSNKVAPIGEDATKTKSCWTRFCAKKTKAPKMIYGFPFPQEVCDNLLKLQRTIDSADNANWLYAYALISGLAQGPLFVYTSSPDVNINFAAFLSSAMGASSVFGMWLGFRKERQKSDAEGIIGREVVQIKHRISKELGNFLARFVDATPLYGRNRKYNAVQLDAAGIHHQELLQLRTQGLAIKHNASLLRANISVIRDAMNQYPITEAEGEEIALLYSDTCDLVDKISSGRVVITNNSMLAVYTALRDYQDIQLSEKVISDFPGRAYGVQIPLSGDSKRRERADSNARGRSGSGPIPSSVAAVKAMSSFSTTRDSRHGSRESPTNANERNLPLDYASSQPKNRHSSEELQSVRKRTPFTAPNETLSPTARQQSETETRAPIVPPLSTNLPLIGSRGFPLNESVQGPAMTINSNSSKRKPSQIANHAHLPPMQPRITSNGATIALHQKESMVPASFTRSHSN